MARGKGLDRQLVGTVLKLEFEVNQELDALSSDLQKELRAASTGDKVTKLKQFERRAEKVIDEHISEYELLVKSYSGAVAGYKASKGLEEL